MKKIIALLFPSLASSFVKIGPARRTVDGALVHFNKAIEELKSVKAINDAEAVKHEKAADKAVEVYEQTVAKADAARSAALNAAFVGQTAAEAEAARAARLAAKLEALLA